MGNYWMVSGRAQKKKMQSFVSLACMVRGKKEIQKYNVSPNAFQTSYLDQNSFGLSQLLF